MGQKGWTGKGACWWRNYSGWRHCRAMDKERNTLARHMCVCALLCPCVDCVSMLLNSLVSAACAAHVMQCGHRRAIDIERNTLVRHVCVCVLLCPDHANYTCSCRLGLLCLLHACSTPLEGGAPCTTRMPPPARTHAQLARVMAHTHTARAPYDTHSSSPVLICLSLYDP